VRSKDDFPLRRLVTATCWKTADCTQWWSVLDFGGQVDSFGIVVAFDRGHE